jgi:anti-sigma factor RsiW
MKHELELKVQAWLDGELPEQEARRIGEWIAHDTEASALAGELGGMRQALFRHEPAAVLGESREFYWGKIERQIERESALRPTNDVPWYARWRQYMAPLAGAAALGCVLVMAVTQSASPSFDEISSTEGGMEAVTFHDQSAQMTVVWLQDNSAVPAEDQPAFKGIPYENEPGTEVKWE